MPLEFIVGLAFDLAEFLRMSLVVSLLAFLPVVAGQKVHQYIKDKYSYSWSVSAFLATAIVLTPIVFALYLIPYGLGFLSASAGGPVPDFMQLTLLDYAMAFILTIFKNALSILLFTVLLMPLLFIASFISEKIGERKKLPRLAHAFATVLATSIVAWLIVFVLDYVGIGLIPAIFWKLYWSPI